MCFSSTRRPVLEPRNPVCFIDIKVIKNALEKRHKNNDNYITYLLCTCITVKLRTRDIFTN